MHILHRKVMKSHECCGFSNDTGFIFGSGRAFGVTCCLPGPDCVFFWEGLAGFQNHVVVLCFVHFHNNEKFETLNEIMSG